MLVTLIVFLLLLGILVFVHELGHFLAAKRAKVLVEEFAFGFRPRLLARKIGETTYALNLLPLGGYVRLHGENEQDTGPRSFRSKTAGQRLLIFVAGSAMNLVLAWLVLIVLFASGFNPLTPGIASNPFVSSLEEIRISQVAPGSPAAAAGLASGEQVIALDEKRLATDQEFVSLVNAERGREVTIVVKSAAGELRTIRATPRVSPPEGEGALGVIIESTGEVRASLFAAPAAAFFETGRIIGLSFQGFIGFVGDLIVRGQVSEEVTGIVGAGALTGIARRLGVEYLAQLLAVISIGLAVVNLMPVLPLDGGHIAALGFEKVAGRPLSDRQLAFFTMVGLSLVIVIFLVVTYKDLIRFNVIGRLLNAL